MRDTLRAQVVRATVALASDFAGLAPTPQLLRRALAAADTASPPSEDRDARLVRQLRRRRARSGTPRPARRTESARLEVGACVTWTPASGPPCRARLLRRGTRGLSGAIGAGRGCPTLCVIECLDGVRRGSQAIVPRAELHRGWDMAVANSANSADAAVRG